MPMPRPASPSRTRRCLRAAASAALALAAALAGAPSFAQTTIRQPGAHTRYSFEAEPHLLVSPFDPPGSPSGDGIGVGFRGTVVVADDGFIAKVDDSVGIGFGLDWVRFERGEARGECTERVDGPNGTSICVEVDGSGSDRDVLFVPLVMQWNFWLTRRWSVFGEPGLFFSFTDDRLRVRPFAFYAGGRYQFSDAVALSLRIGYPTLSVGPSFLF